MFSILMWFFGASCFAVLGYIVGEIRGFHRGYNQGREMMRNVYRIKEKYKQ